MPALPRAASLLSSATEIVAGLGLSQHLVAISHECDFPDDILHLPRATRSLVDSSQPSLAIDQQLKERLRAGLPLYTLNEPLLAALLPEVILTQAQCDVCAIRLEDVCRFVNDSVALQKAHVVSLSPNSLADLWSDVRRVAEALNEPAAGETYCAALQARIEAVESITKALTIQERPRVICLEWTAPLMTAGNWTPELIQIAGGESGIAVPGEHSKYCDWEQIQVYDPEVLVIAPCGFDLARSKVEAAELVKLPGWTNLAAVQADKVFVLDGNAYLNRSGPRLVDTVELLAQILHPCRFPAKSQTQQKTPSWEKFSAAK